jgi:NAD+ kinase
MTPTLHSKNCTTVQTVGIIAKTRLQEASAAVRDVADWLAARGIDIVVEINTARIINREGIETCSRDNLPTVADLILVLGGDGTLLGVAGCVARTTSDVPVLAVNFGSLGFLTEITLPELYESLESVIAGTAGIDERQMLRSKVIRNNEAIADRIVLNDVVLTKAALSNIIDFAITFGDQFVMRSRADGLIISSPTGSTAYNLAAGGPIVHPTVDALLVTPIAPHTLTNRPIVIPTTTPVRVVPTLGGLHQAAYVSFDGQFGFELNSGDNITVERASRPLRVVRSESRSYFAVLREKLKWGER